MRIKKINSITILFIILSLLSISGCNRFHTTRLLESVGYNADECAERDFTHHKELYPKGTNPGRINIQFREFRCRIERICIGKSDLENEECKKSARSYWGFDENNEVYKILKHDDDESDAQCTLKPSSCSPKFKPQENFETNPYWNKKTKSYILPK